VVRLAHAGLIAWSVDEHITLINETCKKIFKTPFVKKLDGLSAVCPDLPIILRDLKPGEKKLVRVEIKSVVIPLSFILSRFALENRMMNVVVVMDLRNELEENESEAWQKLMKILNHEIVNSLSPIKLMSSGLMQKMNEPDTRTAEETLLFKNEVSEGLKAIYNRSSGVLRFIEDYKALTDIPRPEIRKESAWEMISSVVNLSRGALIPESVKVDMEGVTRNQVIPVDRTLIEQVLINLLKNSVQAVEGKGNAKITISSYVLDNREVIEISDNGCGIPFNIRDFIFMPFFTTKKDGSGIGLSWSRQIMKLHHGYIQVISAEGQGSSVRLYF
jgi:nitrogen fixation/metabolism regulation signal transduction histidine kinase